jgi:hypothetical protein
MHNYLSEASGYRGYWFYSEILKLPEFATPILSEPGVQCKVEGSNGRNRTAMDQLYDSWINKTSEVGIE